MDHKEHPSAEQTQSAPVGLNGNGLLKLIRRSIIFALGMSVVLVGVAMLVLPGPGMIVIPAGLAILATEFVWARHWLNYLKRRAQQAAEWTMGVAEAGPNSTTPIATQGDREGATGSKRSLEESPN